MVFQPAHRMKCRGAEGNHPLTLTQVCPACIPQPAPLDSTGASPAVQRQHGKLLWGYIPWQGEETQLNISHRRGFIVIGLLGGVRFGVAMKDGGKIVLVP